MSCNVASSQAAPQPSWDDDIAALELQLGEIDLHDESSKGKYPEDRLPDNELAFLAFQAEIQKYIACLDDQKFAHSIAEGERQVQEDRELALQLNRSDSPEARAAPHVSFFWSPLPRESISHGSSSFGAENWDEDAGPSWTHASHQEKESNTAAQGDYRCCVCLDSFRRCDVLPLECEDIYCRDCLKGLFMRSIKDETLFPPRCHRNPIPLDLIAESMSPEELHAFQLAEIEFTVDDRTYCSQVDCGRFIPPDRITAGMAECEYCGTETCSMCKQKSHLGDDYPKDPALQSTLALAATAGWQRCYRCRAMVELNTGCYHMKCRCKARFCYLCGVRWKHCQCDLGDERHLYNRAEVLVDREAPVPLPHEERQRRIMRVQDELVNFHECAHSRRFERLSYGGRDGFRCEMCDARHWKYILQCRQCHVRVCEDCRRNRT